MMYVFLHACQDSNLKLLVLETSTLPIELHTCLFISIESFGCISNFYTLFVYGIQSVFRYRVSRVLKSVNNRNTNFRFFFDRWNNNHVIVSFF